MAPDPRQANNYSHGDMKLLVRDDHSFHPEGSDPQLKSSQFGEAFHSSDGGIARLCFLLQVVEHLVAVIRSHGNRVSGALH